VSASIPQTATGTEELTYSMVQEHTLIGKILGNRYRILREVGSGGMAWVYLAEDAKEDRLIAVKVLYPQFGEDLSYVQRFNREAKLASTLTDPHIVRVLDYGADRDIYYLIMEFIEGQDLRDILKARGPLPWKIALDMVDQLATALEHAHQHHVVHRDIKPQNMMIENDSGLLKVLDFGIARIPTLPSLTQSGFVGSPYYVSPEQAMGEEVDIRSDIYSSGIVLYELLSGNIPFDAKSPWSIISQHISSDPPPIKLDGDDVPEGIHQLIDRMVTKRPEDRFQTPTALRRAVAAVLSGHTVPDDTLDTRLVISADQQVEMADSLYERALEVIEAEEWARAVDLLNQVLALNPEHPEVSEKLARAKQESILIALYGAAKRATKAGNWEDAVNNLNGIIELDPDYKDAQELMVQARQALEKENRQQFVITRYNEGLAHMEAERWEEAIVAFSEVQRLSPNYERVSEFWAEAERMNNPNLFQRVSRALPQSTWRWGLAAVGIVAVIFLVILAFNSNTPAVGDDENKDQLKVLYEQSQAAIEQGETQQAIALLDDILTQDPDYADAADLRRDLIISLTPTPTPIPTATSTPTPDPVIAMMGDAEDALAIETWDESIAILQAIRSANPTYEEARIASLFCDAYVGRGLQTLVSIRDANQDEEELMGQALADFEAGAGECPKRIDLQDQAARATVYLEALNTSRRDYDTLIQILTPLVSADTNYVNGNAKNMLYTAYLRRGDARRDDLDIVGALGDYEAALTLNVEDPGKAQTRRAELLLAFSQQPQITPEPVETPESSSGGSDTGTNTPPNTRTRSDNLWPA